jgi:hypothetical protein
MSNIIVDGFGHYGIGTDRKTQNRAISAMLSGPYAEVSDTSLISTLPWDTSNLTPYLRGGQGDTARRVLPSTKTVLNVSLHYAAASLPTGNSRQTIISFRDASNRDLVRLVVETTGALTLYDKDNNLLGTTSLPVIVAQTDTFLEMHIDVTSITAAAFVLYVNGGASPTINASGLSMQGSVTPYAAGGVAQFALNASTAGPGASTGYVAHLVVRDTAGTHNNSFPLGDRRVATLQVNADAPAQGWAARPRKKFGAGILDNRTSLNSLGSNAVGVSADAATSLYLGNGDFTIEAQVRFNALPSGSNKAVIFGLWDANNNKRSYQLYIGGPSLENGNTVFVTSTDGTATTVSEVFSYPWVPVTGRWYHVAVSRASGETMFFVDGVQLGLPATDVSTYFAATATAILGGDYASSGVRPDTSLDGFFDEFRLTAGYARYTGGFVAPTAPFTRGAGDPHWSNVVWLSGFESGIADESSYARTLTAQGGAVASTPNDGVFNFQCLLPDTDGGPRDDTFIEAALLPAADIMTQSVIPANNATVTVGTYGAGNTTAVYTWKTTLTGAAFEVLRGATINASLSNLAAAINLTAGAGSTYGTGTVVNNNVTATLLPLDQLQVTANQAGTVGNSLTAAITDANASWASATLTGGLDIPSFSEFFFERPPSNTTVVDSVTLVTRSSKTDVGTCLVQASFVGALNTAADGAINPITTVPTYYHDTFETDPDTGASLTPTTIVGGRVRLNRTA